MFLTWLFKLIHEFIKIKNLKALHSYSQSIQRGFREGSWLCIFPSYWKTVDFEDARFGSWVLSCSVSHTDSEQYLQHGKEPSGPSRPPQRPVRAMGEPAMRMRCVAGLLFRGWACCTCLWSESSLYSTHPVCCSQVATVSMSWRFTLFFLYTKYYTPVHSTGKIPLLSKKKLFNC